MKYIMIPVVLYLLFCCIISCEYSCIDSGVVAELGGCNKEATCGARLEDGRIVHLYMPVKGGKYCIEEKSDFNWKWLGFQ